MRGRCCGRKISKSVISCINHSITFSRKASRLLKIRECNSLDAEKRIDCSGAREKYQKDRFFSQTF